MNIEFIHPSFEITLPVTGRDMLAHIERAGRTCYKSEDKITADSSEEFVRMIIKRGHESVLEHISFSARFICDRGVSHELVRHRIASFSQESTRYVGYKDAIQFVIPAWCSIEPATYSIDTVHEQISDNEAEKFWISHMFETAYNYRRLLDLGWRPEQARSILPNSLKTEIVVTANLREWRHIIKLRASKAAHPDMRAMMLYFHKELIDNIPIIFDEI